MLAGCGAAPATPTNPEEKPTITTQPAPQTAPLGQSATFSVVATGGTAPLNYQWSKNGSPIAGATQASYETPLVQLADSGDEFTVVVSDAAWSVNSDPAALTVGPRSPKSGDLRFQQVDAPSTADGPNIGGLATNLLPLKQATYTNWIGSGFKIGPGVCGSGGQYDCTWFYSALYLPANVSGLSVTYRSDAMENFASDLAIYSASDAVINSLDEEPGNDIFALEATSTQQTTGFTVTQSSVPLSGLQALATQLGTESEVITAVSYNASGQIDVFAYSWQGDPATVYEVLVSPVTIDTFRDAAEQMAGQGYIITAFGGNETSGYVVVGTKVQGDTLARPIIVSPNMSTPGKGFASVAMPTNWGVNPYVPLWTFEQ